MPKRKQHSVPQVGTKFEKTYKGKQFVLSVVAEDGRTQFRVGRTTFSTPTAAAKNITGGEVNGWKFWRIE
jgi:hypothetical protein